MQVVRMLIDACEDVTSLVHIEASWAQVSRELHEQVKGKLDRARQLHEDMVEELRMASKVAYQQLEVAQDDIKKDLAKIDTFR